MQKDELEEKINLCEREIILYMTHLTKVLHLPKKLKITVTTAVKDDLTKSITQIITADKETLTFYKAEIEKKEKELE